MNMNRVPESMRQPAATRTPAPDRRPVIEDKGWYASSRDLAQGLVVQELDESVPVELSTLM
jgi:hypothetical protein